LIINSSFELQTVANVLKENTTLEFLDLGNNLIQEEGAMAIANELKANSSLTPVIS
jgi:Leucine Rich repeat